MIGNGRAVQAAMQMEIEDELEDLSHELLDSPIRARREEGAQGVEAQAEFEAEGGAVAGAELGAHIGVQTAPQAGVQAAHQADAHVASQTEIQAAPEAEAQAAHQAGAQAAPQTEAQAAPQAEVQAAPQAEAQAAPQAEAQAAPQAEAESEESIDDDEPFHVLRLHAVRTGRIACPNGITVNLPDPQEILDGIDPNLIEDGKPLVIRGPYPEFDVVVIPV